MTLTLHQPRHDLDVTMALLLAAVIVRFGGKVELTSADLDAVNLIGSGVTCVSDGQGAFTLRYESAEAAQARSAALDKGVH